MADVRRVNFGSKQTLLNQPPENTYSITSQEERGGSSEREEEVLYPLNGLFEEVVKQEEFMWNKTQGVRIPLDDEDTGHGEGIEEELLSVGRGSFTSFHSSVFNHDNSLYLIRYGQLTKTVHKYFRKLEKEHSCLYLSGRRANFQNLRLHTNPRQMSLTLTNEEDASNSAIGGMLRVHSLRDEERFVYRCALISAQFPMLSAPSPPDDRSPSPPFPPFPIGTAPSESSVAMSLLNTSNQGSQVQPLDDSVPISRPANSELSPDDPEPRPLGTAPSRPSDPVSDMQEPVSKSLNSATVMGEPCERLQPLTPPTRSRSSRANIRRHRRSLYRSVGGDESDEDENEKSHKKREGIKCELSDGMLKLDDSDDEVVRLCHSRGSKLLDPLGREQPFPAMVNREMLCTLVRRAFNQTEEQQIQYDQILRHENGRKSKGEILARELVAQLQVLENNAHPFYKPRNFVTRNGYDIWIQGEKKRIRDQIDQFWHYQLPTPHAWAHHVSPNDYHKAYVMLLEKVICSESRSPRREPVHGGRTPSAPLSATSHRLLTEFGLRYGVGELFRQIVYLEYLAKHFDYEVWYIRHCTEQLRLVRSLLPRNRSRTTATRKEMEILKNTVFLLHGQTDNSLTRIDRLFQETDPQLGVATLIDLLKEILDAEQTLFNQRVRSIEDSLQRYLKGGFALRYERRKEIISDEISSARDIAPFKLTPILVNALLHSIRDEVNSYKDTYQVVFRRYFNIVPFAQVEFYKLLCSDACNLCGKTVHSPQSRQKLDLEMLGLLYRLNDRDTEWSNVIPLEMQQWRNQFVHLALIWMDVLAKQIKEWILESLEEDQWTLLTFSLPPPNETGEGRTSQMTSASSHTLASPFPVSLSGFPLSLPSTLTTHKASAFTPIDKEHKERTLSPLSEGSGGITELSSSHNSYDSDNPVHASSSQQHRTTGIHNNQLLRFSKGPHASILADSPLSLDATPPTVVPLMDASDSTPRHCPIVNGNNEGVVGFVVEADVHSQEHRGSEDKNIFQEPVQAKNSSTNSFQNQSSLSVSTPSSTSCLSATVSIDDEAPLDPQNEQDNNGVAASTPTLISVKEEYKEDLSEEVVKPKPVSSAFAPVPGPLPSTIPDSPLMSHVPSHPPLISVIPSLSDTNRLYPYDNQSDRYPVVDPDKHPGNLAYPKPNRALLNNVDHDSVSPPISPSSSSSTTTAGSLALVSYYLPLSSSPIDLITMFSRMASFIGTLLNVLTPKLKRGFKHMGTGAGPLEVPSEVVQARKLVTNIQQHAENMKIEFLRKIHKVMVGSIKMYADNLLCMDLCCWMQEDAINLLGEEGLHNLNRRKESGEIWGCRHISEAKRGMHPGGLPCLKRTTIKFESITRDMCVRVNNIHLLLMLFPSLESHVYNATIIHSSSHPEEYDRPDLSSESGSQLKLDGRPPHMQAGHAFPHRFRPEKRKKKFQKPITILPPEESNTTTNGSDTGTTSRSGLGMTPLSRRKVQTGFQSNESHQLMEYLKNVQQCQLKMICVRMNRFFKPALSLLLELKLGNCPISRRLEPLATFLSRHCTALKRYLYPSCFAQLMKFLWTYILEDVEGEALKLIKLNKRVVNRASLLLQTITHLINIFHREGNGFSLEILTSSTEYLLALLNVFLQPTDRLIKNFNRLSSPHFTQDQISLDQSPVAIEPQVIYELSKRLHTYRKCFTGTEFVETLTELGQQYEEDTQDELTHSNQTPTHRLVNYNIPYAKEVGQYLLREGILICLYNYQTRNGLESSNTTLESASASRLNAIDTTFHGDLITERPVSLSPGGSSTTPSSDVSSPVSDNIPTPVPAQFRSSDQSYYRFTTFEDSPTGSFFQRSQILSCTTTTTTSSSRAENRMSISDFDRARFGTLFLILDVCQKRAGKDKEAKNFLSQNETVRISNQRTGNNISCSKIFRI